MLPLSLLLTAAAWWPAPPTVLQRPALRSSASVEQVRFSLLPGARGECRLDGGAWRRCASPYWLRGLVPGRHRLQLRARARQGISPAITLRWQNVAAGVRLQLQRADTRIVWTEAGRFRCRLDGGAWRGCTSPVDVSLLTEGAHRLEVQQTEGGGRGQLRWTAPPLGRGGVFAVDCAPTVRRASDPVVMPGMDDMSHLHEFFGPQQVPDRARAEDLLRQPTSCRLGVDRSAYWIPALYVDDQLEPARFADADNMQAYYRLDPGSRAIPPGLVMLAGSKDSLRGDPQVASWSCQPSSNYGQPLPPACPAGQWLLAEIRFPSCWDGLRLDSPDHRAHMAYDRPTGCPDSHPVRLARLVLFHNYAAYGSRPVRLASGGAGGLHADFVSGWQPTDFQRLLRSCASRDCGHLQQMP